MPEEQDVLEQSESDDSTEEDDSSESGERTYSQADLDRLLQQAKDSAFAEARRTLKPKRQEQRKGRKSDESKGDSGDSFARKMAQRDAIDDALDGISVTSEQRKALRQQIEAADPDDPDAWAESFVGMFLASKKQEPDAKTQAAEQPVRKPGDDPGPAQSLPVWERPSNPFEWSEDDVARLEAAKGRREAHRIIRKKAEEFARTMRIQVAATNRR